MNACESINTDLNHLYLHKNHVSVFADVAIVNVPGL
jgi:hypothetical protein